MPQPPTQFWKHCAIIPPCPLLKFDYELTMPRRFYSTLRGERGVSVDCDEGCGTFQACSFMVKLKKKIPFSGSTFLCKRFLAEKKSVRLQRTKAFGRVQPGYLAWSELVHRATFITVFLSSLYCSSQVPADLLIYVPRCNV